LQRAQSVLKKIHFIRAAVYSQTARIVQGCHYSLPRKVHELVASTSCLGGVPQAQVFLKEGSVRINDLAKST
jgi:hypothetical protein